MDARLVTVEREWQARQKLPFPDQEEIPDRLDFADLVLLDSDTAACIMTFVGSRGTLGLGRTRILRQCVRELAAVIPELERDAREYFSATHQIATAILIVLDEEPRRVRGGW